MLVIVEHGQKKTRTRNMSRITYIIQHHHNRHFHDHQLRLFLADSDDRAYLAAITVAAAVIPEAIPLTYCPPVIMAHYRTYMVAMKPS